jgi:peptidoglycan DL-endopeptidase CwlO
MATAERDLASTELWQYSLERSRRRRAIARRRRSIRRMSVPLALVAATAAVNGPALAAGAKLREGDKTRGMTQRILKRGAVGPDVIALQRALGVAADGVFGPVTTRAVRRFQASHGLLVDGEVGPLTRAALASAAAPGDGILRRGDSGEAVAALQRALGIADDGVFGPLTDAAVRRFQRAHGLLVDGQVGPQTRAALARGSASAVRATPGDGILRRGDTGAAVAALQRALGVPADGDFGPVTAAAVRAFQARHGLFVDGQVGPRTRAVLAGGSAGGGGGSSSGGSVSAGGGTTAASGAAARAVQLALGQVGRPYRWGGASPSGFDCSGLVMWAYSQVGVPLPHNSAAQYGVGRAVSQSELRPGDLVFFNGLGHVGMWVGNGRFVDSPNSGRTVSVETLSGWYAQTYVGARRVA